MASQPRVCRDRRHVGVVARAVNEKYRACPPERENAQPGEREGGSNSVVESQPSKLLVAGSIPVSRSKFYRGAPPRRTPSPSLARPGGRAPLRRGASLRSPLS